MTILRSKKVIFRPNLFLLFLSTPYLSLIRSILAPYILHSEVPLDGESTGLVRSKYISGMAYYRMIEQSGRFTLYLVAYPI